MELEDEQQQKFVRIKRKDESRINAKVGRSVRN